MHCRIYRIVGRTACSGALFIAIGILTLIAFFSLIPVSSETNTPGPIKSIATVTGSLAAALGAVGLYGLRQSHSRRQSLLAFGLVLIGDLTIVVIQFLFMIRLLPLEANLVSDPLGFGIAGVGLFIFSHLASHCRSLTPRVVTLILGFGRKLAGRRSLKAGGPRVLRHHPTACRPSLMSAQRL